MAKFKPKSIQESPLPRDLTWDRPPGSTAQVFAPGLISDSLMIGQPLMNVGVVGLFSALSVNQLLVFLTEKELRHLVCDT